MPDRRKSLLVLALIALCGAAASSSDLAQRRQTVLSMPPAEQQELLRKQERLAALPPEEQDRLRKLAADLQHDPQGVHLRKVLEKYHEWLSTLSPGQRAELIELNPQDRVARIRSIQQQTEGRHGLTAEDVRRIGAWLENLVWQHRDRWLADAPAGRREQLEKLDEPMRRRVLLWSALQRWQTSPPNELLPSSEELQQLARQLSPQAQQRMNGLKSQQEKRNLVKEWLQAAVQQHFEGFGAGRMIPPVAPEEMESFFKGLTIEERDRLLAMPREQMQRELRRLYYQDPARGGPGRGFPRPAIPGEMVPSRRPMNPPRGGDNRGGEIRGGENVVPQRPFTPGPPAPRDGRNEHIKGDS